MISFNEALQLTYEPIQALDPEDVELLSAVDHITACDLPGLVNSPSVDVFLKNGCVINFSSHFQMISTVAAIIKMPQGRSRLETEQIVEGQLLSWIF